MWGLGMKVKGLGFRVQYRSTLSSRVIKENKGFSVTQLQARESQRRGKGLASLNSRLESDQDEEEEEGSGLRVYAVAEEADVLEEGHISAQQLRVDRHHDRPDPHLHRVTSRIRNSPGHHRALGIVLLKGPRGCGFL